MLVVKSSYPAYFITVQPKNITIITEKGTIAANEEEELKCVIYRVKPQPEDIYVSVEDSDYGPYRGDWNQVNTVRNAAVIEMTLFVIFTEADNGMTMRCNVVWGDNVQEYTSEDMPLNITCEYYLRYPMGWRRNQECRLV